MEDNEKRELNFIKKFFNEKKIDSPIDESKCIELIKKAIKDSIPKVEKEVDGEKILGFSFEIENTVDLDAFFDYCFTVHFLTDEILKHCANPYDTHYTWGRVESETESAEALTDYLLKNTIPDAFESAESLEEMNEEERTANEWYKNEWNDIYDKKADERALIRKCVALAVGELNKEKFFSRFDDFFVYPYDGDMIEKEELIEHFKLMQNSEDDECFFEYLNDIKED